MTTPTTQALREAVERVLLDDAPMIYLARLEELTDAILSAIQPLLAPAASEREKALEDALEWAKFAINADYGKSQRDSIIAQADAALAIARPPAAGEGNG